MISPLGGSTEPEPRPNAPARPAIRRRASAFHDRQRRRAWLLRIVAAGVVATAMLGVTLVGGVAAAGLRDLPGIGALVDQPMASDTMVYDRTGKILLADLHPPGYQHYDVRLSAMGRYLPKATVAIEDANFWNEPGIDPPGIGRAAVADVRAHAAVQGGSTITQQLVKLRLVGGGSSFTRKLKEAPLAVRVSTTYPKTRILEAYLNTISYGNTANGAAAAARVYFHREPGQLDLAQAALLAGLPQNPTLLDPLTHWDLAKQRQRQVLDAMVRSHDVTRQQADEAFAEDLSPPAHLFGPTTLKEFPGFVDSVTRELTDRLGAGAITGGLTVVTTLDVGLQQIAQRSVADAVRANSERDVTDGAMVAMDPRTGQVLAMVGSAGPGVAGSQYNFAVWPPRSPGSSFKVFTYTAAIESRQYTMVTPISDAPLLVQPPGDAQPYMPRNYDLRYHGACQLQACLGNSLNVPAVEVELGTGIQNVVEQARRMGAPPYKNPSADRFTNDDAAGSFGPSLTLGGYGETPLQMATGVSVLADRGMLHEPEMIVNARGADGRQVLGATSGSRQVVDPGTAYIVSQMLSNDANRTLAFGRGSPLVLDGRTAAAKTGTAEDFADGWTVGYTPSLAAAVWMGNADHHPMAKGTDGVYVAAPAWHDFMTGALDGLGKGDEWYDPPGDVQARPGFGGPAYFLTGTSAATRPPALPSWAHLGVRDPGPGCRSWIANGRDYFSCARGSSGLPGDPGPSPSPGG
ncbi:MAG TPA: transglycosylase domain-containing protein [Candidatus Dormibacteraeota bacterium]|nr:transglycosylase domain-containing protein [Candidatus Dormibacteraeota bacterium]